MPGWKQKIEACLAAGQPVCRIVIAEAKGSTPREAGADMYVTKQGIRGTIGGGTLEFEAMAYARQILAELAANKTGDKTGFIRQFRRFVLGPHLGQCCGGQVSLLFEGFSLNCLPALQAAPDKNTTGYLHSSGKNLGLKDIYVPAEQPVLHPLFEAKTGQLQMPVERTETPFYLYGAGHVGRAVMGAVAGLCLDKIWIDSDDSRFPEIRDPAISYVPASDMTRIASHAPKGAIHLVMSYSHRIDEALVYTILKKGDLGRLGLIGSYTKYQRFCHSLKKQGIGDSLLDQLVCPIGLPDLQSKDPAHIGLSVAAQIASWLEADFF